MDIERTLTDFISDEIAYDRGGTLAVDEPLLDGVLDSTDVLRLVVFVEERFGVQIDDDELVPENFETVAMLANLVRSKSVG